MLPTCAILANPWQAMWYYAPGAVMQIGTGGSVPGCVAAHAGTMCHTRHSLTSAQDV